MTPDTSVLVVDDQPIVVELVTRMLLAMGVSRVEGAADGIEALGALRRRRVSLVVADVDMAPMTGLQMLRAMRADAALKGVPVLMMTASPTPELQERALQARVNGTLVKPFTPEALREAVLLILRVWGDREAPDHAA